MNYSCSYCKSKWDVFHCSNEYVDDNIRQFRVCHRTNQIMNKFSWEKKWNKKNLNRFSCLSQIYVKISTHFFLSFSFNNMKFKLFSESNVSHSPNDVTFVTYDIDLRFIQCACIVFNQCFFLCIEHTTQNGLWFIFIFSNGCFHDVLHFRK